MPQSLKAQETTQARVGTTGDATDSLTAATATGHTPGPWREGRDGNSRVYGPDGEGEHSGLIAEVFKGRANVRLIAAAPDLLAACKALDQEGPSNDVYKLVRAAVAKADGR